MSSQWLTLIFIIVLISRYDYIGFSFTIIKIKLTWQTLRRTEWSIFLLRTGNHVKEVRLLSGDWKWLSHKSSRLLPPLRFANWPLSKKKKLTSQFSPNNVAYVWSIRTKYTLRWRHRLFSLFSPTRTMVLEMFTRFRKGHEESEAKGIHWHQSKRPWQQKSEQILEKSSRVSLFHLGKS